MDWGWLCNAKAESFADAFPQVLGFLYPLGLKKGPLLNSYFATVALFGFLLQHVAALFSFRRTLPTELCVISGIHVHSLF